MSAAVFLVPRPPPLPLPLPGPSSPMETIANPWDSLFGIPEPPPDRHEPPEPDLDQQLSQKLLRTEPTSIHSFPQTQETHISPAAMFLAAFSAPAQPTRMPDDEGESVAGYVLGPVIGRGGFSTIRRASSPSGGVVAIKIVRRSDVEGQSDPSLTRKRLAHETEIWSSLSHEHILPLFSVEHTHYADFYVTLLCPAGSLFDILRRDGTPALPHDDAGMMFRQVVRGLRYLHEIAGYVHRDIKLENVLVDEMGVCRIADFGLTRKIGQTDCGDRSDIQDIPAVHRHRSAIHHTVRHAKPPAHPSILRHRPRRHRISTPIGEQPPAPVHPVHAFQPGSLPYAAPELLCPPTLGKHHGANPAQDMWALGCLLYALLTGRLPFSDSFEPRLTVKILHGVYDMPSNIGLGTSRLLKGCLEHEVQNRWTIAMVDELAWDIGWGQIDESPPVSQRDEFESIDCSDQPSAPMCRRSRSPCDRDTTVGVPSSRHRRSLSCTSITTSSSFSTRSTSQSISRPPTTLRLPLAAACDDVGPAVLNAPTVESSPTPLDMGGSAILSPISPVERGRSRTKIDPRLTDRFAPSPSIGASTALSDFGHELSRGREMYCGADKLDNTARWASALRLNTIAEVATHLNGMSSPALERLRRIQNVDAHHSGGSKEGKRAESMPPVSPAWPPRPSRIDAKKQSLSSRPGGSSGVRGVFLREPSAAPITIDRKNCARSHSVGHEHSNVTKCRLF